MYYGLSELNVNIQMAIVEEIKLTLYTTFAEQQEKGAAKEAEEEEKKRLEEIQEIRDGLISSYPNFINKDNVDDYIFVDENGHVTCYYELPDEVFNSSTYEDNVFYLETWLESHKSQPEVFGTQLSSYTQKKEAEKSSANTASPSMDASKSYTESLDLANQSGDSQSIINDIYQLTMKVGSQILGAEKFNQNINKEYLSTLSMEDLLNRKQELILILAGENKDKTEVVNKFTTVQTDAQTGEKTVNAHVPEYIMSLLRVQSITTIEGIFNFLNTLRPTNINFYYQSDDPHDPNYKKIFYFYSMNAFKKIVGVRNEIGFLYSDFKIDVYSNEHGVAYTYSIIDSSDGRLAKIDLNHLSISTLGQQYKDFLKKIFGDYLPIFKITKEQLQKAIKYIDLEGKAHPEDKTLENFFIEMYNNCASQMNSNISQAFTNVCSPCFESISQAKQSGYTDKYYTFNTNA